MKREKKGKQKPLEVRAKERKSDFTGVEVLSTGNGVGKSIDKGENLVFAVAEVQPTGKCFLTVK